MIIDILQYCCCWKGYKYW